MKRDAEKRLPELEEISAVAASMQNIFIAAEAKGISGFWSTGGMIHSDEMKAMLKLEYEDVIMGIIYLGYSDHKFEGKRVIPIEEKVTWVK